MKYIMIFLLLMLNGCQSNESVNNINVRQKVFQPVYVLSKKDKNKRLSSTEITSKNQVQLINPPSGKDEVKIIPNQGYVFVYNVAQESTGVCEDWLNCTTGAFIYPFININNEEASQVNQMTYRRVSGTYQKDKFIENDIKAVHEFKTYENGDCLSVLLKWQSFYSKAAGGMWNVDDDRIFVAYNYDLVTNKTLSNLDLLAKFGYTVETYEQKITEQLIEMGINVVDIPMGIGNINVEENEHYVYYSTEKYLWFDPYGVQFNEESSCLYIDENRKLSVILKVNVGEDVNNIYYIKVDV
ncbi:hypothetical protein [Dielma fastidiosa]|uniref:hypothetical protein n=1 Tax=Dielma fastidiosa TaxID=1034346 RepID=UPI000E4D9A1F|nr:hypothetical protein [Dielma fastidiosa]RHN03201.1 hypothetical protein DWZ33_03780 [Dielma fastidiosa]